MAFYGHCCVAVMINLFVNTCASPQLTLMSWRGFFLYTSCGFAKSVAVVYSVKKMTQLGFWGLRGSMPRSSSILVPN